MGAQRESRGSGHGHVGNEHLLLALLEPASGVPSSPPGTDKLVHLLLFAVLAVTARMAGGRTVPVLAGLVGYAALSEVAHRETVGGPDELAVRLRAVVGEMGALASA